ncbi:MAG: hypothetical protein H7246_11070 [Phycisphaerae bacterium]|nr:hypothetical protein [Saprospiraceae bacterium]
MKKFKEHSSTFSSILRFCSMAHLAFLGIIMLLSNNVVAQRPKTNICDYLKVTIIKQSDPVGPAIEIRDCCYKISINNAYDPLAMGQGNIPMKFEISTKNPTKISSSSTISTLLVQQPTAIPPLTNMVSFTGKKQLSVVKPLPQGSTDVATICINNKSLTWLYFSWKNKAGSIICKDSVQVSCESTTTSCCAFSLHFLYNKQSVNQYKKIRVTAMGTTQIIYSDPDEWQQTLITPNYVEYHLGGSVLPYGETIDNDFMLYLKQITGDQLLQIDWFNASNVIKSTFKIKIPCNGDFKEDQDWTQYVQNGVGFDSNTYAFAVKEEDEEDCGFEEKDFKTHDCTIKLDDIKCESNSYKLYLHGPQAPDNSDYDEYTWKVKKNDVSQPNVTGKNPTPALTLIAGENYTIETIFVIKKGLKEVWDTCSATGSIKIPKINPDFNYVKSHPCKLQYDFSVSDLSNVTGVAWACVGISTFPSSGNTVTHEFSAAGTYEITVTLTDKYGCTHSKKKSIVISTKCQPNFEWEYSFCHCNYPGKSEVPIKVAFTNLSEGGICPIKYTWQFGDGQTQIFSDSDPRSFDHTYNVPLNPATPDCRGVGKTFMVTLTMEDAKGCKEVKTSNVTVEPCKFHFEVKTCTDGKIMMKAIDKNGDDIAGYWNLPGLNVLDGLSLVDVKLPCVVFGVSATGTYNISFEGFCPTGGKCKRDTAIIVVVECCAKNDVVKTYSDNWLNSILHPNGPFHPAFSDGSDAYRMKCKFAQRQYPLYPACQA